MPITIDLFSQLDAEHLSRTTQHMTHTLVSLFAGAGAKRWLKDLQKHLF